MVSMFDRTSLEAKLRRAFEETVPFNRVLGLKVESLDAQAPKLRFDMKPELIGNPRRQILHGGVIAGVLDVAAGFAIHLAVIKNRTEEPKEDQLPTIGTIDLRIDYLRPATGERFELRAQVLRLGSRVASTRMEFFGPQDKLLATGAAAYMVS